MTLRKFFVELASTVFAVVGLAIFRIRPGTVRDLVKKRYGTVVRTTHPFCQIARPVIFIAMPKSASKTIAGRLAEELNSNVHLIASKTGRGIWPNNTVISNRKLIFAVMMRKVAHEHCVANQVTIQRIARVTDHIIVHVRDPRQVLVSMAHHFFESGKEVGRFGVDSRQINSEDLVKTFDYLISNVFPVLVQYVCDWREASKSNVLEVSFFTYEEFLSNPGKYLSEVLNVLGVDRVSVNSNYVQHYRRGQADEWRTALTAEQRASVNNAMPSELLQLFNWPEF
jgi:hypothetical protein